MKAKARIDAERGATWAARGALTLGLLSATLLVLLHGLEPEFDPSWRFISEYMLGQFGWMMHLSFFALAASQMLCLVAVARDIRVWYGYAGLAVLLVSGAGIALAAVFTTDPITAGYQSLSFSGTMHVLGASLDYTPVAAVLLSLALLRQPAWKRIRVRLLSAAVFSFLYMVAFMVSLPPDGTFGPGVGAGLVGRVLVLSYVVWISVVSLHIVSLSPGRKAQGAEASVAPPYP